MRRHLSCMRPALLAAVVSLTAHGAAAQSPAVRPAPQLEWLAGYAGFVDEATVDHGVLGAAARLYLSPRIALGPEFVYMRGPAADRDLYLTGNLTFDLLPPPAGGSRRLSPFVVAGGGFFQHRDRFGAADFVSHEGAFTAGGGLRWWAGDRFYVLADVRLGWEPHIRVNTGFGFRL